jgi:hypothetical protein
MATGMFVCVHVAHAITDADGRYHVSGWKSQAPQFSVDSFNWTADVYKPGLWTIEACVATEHHDAEVDGTPDERIKFLRLFCGPQ